MPLSDFERQLLDRVVQLRTFVNKVDAPTLHQLLNDEAALLITVQRQFGELYETTEKAMQRLEHFIHQGAYTTYPVAADNLVKQWRVKNPRKD
jgi:hypothetical protein